MNKNQNGVNPTYGIAATVFGLLGVALGLFVTSYIALISGIVSLALALRARKTESFTPAARFGLFLAIVCFALFVAMLIRAGVYVARYY